MKRKLNKFVFLFILPVCMILLSGFFSVAATQTAYAVSGNGGAIYVGANSTYNYNRGSISGSKASGNGGGVYVDAGGTFNMTGGTISGNTAMKGGGVYVSTNGNFTLNSGEISGNTATEGSGGNIYNGGTFVMNGGTVGKSSSPALFYNFYNTTTKLYGGNFYENIYSYSDIEAKVEANITGQIEFVETGVLTIENYAGTTPKYTIRVASTREKGAIIVFKGGSEIAPDLSKIVIGGYDTNNYVISCEKDSNNVWTIGLSQRKTTVTFNPTFGTCETTSKVVDYGATYGDLPSAYYQGHVFNGWSLNYVDVEKNVFGLSDCTRDGTTFTFDTESLNTSDTNIAFQVQTYKDTSTFVDGLSSTGALGVVSFTFTKNDSFNYLRVKLNGNNRDAILFINATGLTNGETYVFQANIQEISMNHMVVKDIKIEKNSRNIATTFNDDTVTESTIVKVPTNHTLFARWTERKVTVRGNNGEGESSYLGDLNEVISLPSLSTPENEKFRGFQGNSAYIGFNDQSQLTWYTIDSKYKFEDLITVNCWVYLDNWTTFTRAISCTEGGSWNFEKDTVNNEVVVRFAIYDKGVGYKSTNGVALSSISSGWHMLTGVFDGTKAYFYFDADLKATSSVFSSGKIGYNANNSIIVGAEAGWQENQIDTGIPVLPGKVRNVTIINSAFSSSDIARVYNAGYMASILFYGFSNKAEDILEAQWETAVYDVKFDPTNGESVTTGSAKFGQSYGSYFPSNPTKNGYNFVGWSKNFFNHNMAIIDDCCSQNGTTFTFDTGSANTNSGSMLFAVQGCIGTSTYVKDLCSTQSIGLVSFVITKDSSYTFFKIKLNGNNKDAYFYIDATHLANGQYVLQANILEMSMNRIVVKDIMIEQSEKSLTTDSTSSALSTSSVCSESCGHTLFAWWQDKTANVIVKNLSGGRYEGSVMGNASGIWSGTYKVGDTLTISYSPNGLYSFSKVVKGTNWNGATIQEGSVSNINYTITEEDCDNGTIDFRICYTISGILHSVTNGVVDDATGGTVRLYSYQTPAGLVTNGWAYYGPNTSKEIFATAIGDYTFKGWFKNSNCTGTPVSTDAEYNFTDGTTGDFEYYALFINYRNFPSTWKTEIASTTYMTTTITQALTSIKFAPTVPSGYTQIGTLSTGLPVYKGTTATDIAFVAGRIFAPENSFELFSDFSKLTTLDMSVFDTSNVTNMRSMFYKCSALTSLDVSGFDTSKVTSMYYMFYKCSALTSLDVSGFDTSNVTNMSEMFEDCSSLTSLNLSNFNTSNVTNMSWMFAKCSSLTSLDVNSFNTTKVTDMSYMFSGCSKLTSLDVSGFDTSNVTDMSNMFQGCSSLTSLNVSNFDTTNVTDMGFMFANCSKLTSLNLSSFNTTNVTDMGFMFSGCSKLTSLDLSSFNMTKVTYSAYMLDFGSSNKIEVLKTPYNNTMNLAITTGSTLYNKANGKVVTSVPANTSSSLTYENGKIFPSTWKTEIASTTYMTTTIRPADLTNIKFVASVPSGYTKIGTLSTGLSVYKGTTATDIAFVAGRIFAPVNSSSLFSSLTSLLNIDFSAFDTSQVTNMYKMFYNSAVTSLDLKNFNTKLVTDMSYMFAQCVNLTSLNVTSFDTLKVTNMDSIFFMCSNLASLNVTNFETMNVTNMNSMFNACNSLTSLDLSGFNTGSATNMGGMFYQCTSLESVILTSFRTTSVTNMDNMFGQCRSLIVLDLKKFNMSSVTSASKMLVFGTSSKLHKLVTPYNNTITLEVTGSTTFYDSNGNAVYGVPANTSSSLTYYTAESAHSFKTSTYYSQIAKNRVKHNVSTTKTCTVCYYSKTTETTEAHSFLSTGSCSKCGFSVGTQYILKNNYDDDRDIDIFFEKDKQRKEFFVLKVAG